MLNKCSKFVKENIMRHAAYKHSQLAVQNIYQFPPAQHTSSQQTEKARALNSFPEVEGSLGSSRLL
jgi:hypothetical protein